MDKTRHIVICKDEGKYYLATRQAFHTPEQAGDYAKSIHPSRDALVIECGRGVDFREPDGSS